MTEYHGLDPEQINRQLFDGFKRHQVVRQCLRRENGAWTAKDIAYVDDWSEDDFKRIIASLTRAASSGGYVCGAFCDGYLKGFASVEPEMFGGKERYLDLNYLHVSEDMRRRGIGRRLFEEAKRWAKDKGARKLYISAHSAADSQAFYIAMGCVDAAVYNQKHVKAEPYDRQMECLL